MKKLTILLILINLFACQEESKQSDLINLKLTEIQGYGPFEKRFGFLDWTPLTEKGIWGNTEIKTTGIPKNWTKSNVTQVWFDSHQFAYQNYKQGNLSDEFFNDLKVSWKIDLNNNLVSEFKLNNNPVNGTRLSKINNIEFAFMEANPNDFSATPVLLDISNESMIYKSNNRYYELANLMGNSFVKNNLYFNLIIGDDFQHYILKSNYQTNENTIIKTNSIGIDPNMVILDIIE